MVNLLKDTEKQKEKQKWSKVNIILNLLWILLFCFMIFILGMGDSSISDILYFFDVPSLILIIGFLILALGIGGQMKYFWLGLKAAYVTDTSKIEEKVQLEKAEYALGFGIRIVMLTGIMTALISFVRIMIYLDDPSALGPNLAVATLTVLYGVALSMVLMVFKARVHNLIIE